MRFWRRRQRPSAPRVLVLDDFGTELYAFMAGQLSLCQIPRPERRWVMSAEWLEEVCKMMYSPYGVTVDMQLARHGFLLGYPFSVEPDASIPRLVGRGR